MVQNLETCTHTCCQPAIVPVVVHLSVFVCVRSCDLVGVCFMRRVHADQMSGRLFVCVCVCVCCVCVRVCGHVC